MSNTIKYKYQLTRNLAIDMMPIENQNGVASKYEISFSSEAPIQRLIKDPNDNKEKMIDEILIHQIDCIDLSRINDVGVLLFSHGNHHRIGNMPIGKIHKAWLDVTTKKCRAVISFDETDSEALVIKSKFENKMLSGISFGYRIDEAILLRENEKTTDGIYNGPALLGTKWSPYEISLEPTPADCLVGFGKSILKMEEKEMDEINETKVTEITDNTVKGTLTIEKSNDNEERARCTNILKLCRNFNVDATTYIEKGASIENVKNDILSQISRSSEPLKAGIGVGTYVENDEMDKIRAAAVDGLLLRGGVNIDKPANGAINFRGMSLKDIAAETLVRSGVTDAHRLSKDEIFKRAMTPSSHFAAIASDVAHKSMSKAYNIAPTTYQEWTSTASATDFKPTKIYQISEAGDLKEINENGEIQFDEVNDRHIASRQLLTFGRSWGLTRQTFYNDDVDILTTIPRAYARAARRGINKAVYNILKSNPTMQDGKKLFAKDHKNLCIGARPSTKSFAEALANMRKQTNLNGNERLNIKPAFVLSPAELEVEIGQLLLSQSDPSVNNSNVKNIFAGTMTLITDAELDLDSGNSPYYFAANPFDLDTIEVSYLNGNDLPNIETKIGFDFDGILFRILIDYGITLVDYRGLQKNPSVAL